MTDQTAARHAILEAELQRRSRELEDTKRQLRIACRLIGYLGAYITNLEQRLHERRTG